jgi:hypothetical protein
MVHVGRSTPNTNAPSNLAWRACFFRSPPKIESNYMFRKEYQERNDVNLRRGEDLKHEKRDFYGVRRISQYQPRQSHDQHMPRAWRMERPEDIRTFKIYSDLIKGFAHFCPWTCPSPPGRRVYKSLLWLLNLTSYTTLILFYISKKGDDNGPLSVRSARRWETPIMLCLSPVPKSTFFENSEKSRWWVERAVQNTIENKKCCSSCFFVKWTVFRKTRSCFRHGVAALFKTIQKAASVCVVNLLWKMMAQKANLTQIIELPRGSKAPSHDAYLFLLYIQEQDYKSMGYQKNARTKSVNPSTSVTKTFVEKRKTISSLYLPRNHTSSEKGFIMVAWSAPAVQNEHQEWTVFVSFACPKIFYIPKIGTVCRNGVLARSRKANPEKWCLRFPPASKSSIFQKYQFQIMKRPSCINHICAKSCLLFWLFQNTWEQDVWELGAPLLEARVYKFFRILRCQSLTPHSKLLLLQNRRPQPDGVVALSVQNIHTEGRCPELPPALNLTHSRRENFRLTECLRRPKSILKGMDVCVACLFQNLIGYSP